MYIEITNRCNMKCAHCCMNAKRKGQDMSLEMFQTVLKLDSMVSIGGGEPTLHPLFWQFLGLALSNAECVWLATNGSQTNTALALAKMAKHGVIGCALSQDHYHDPIDPRVLKAFTNEREQHYKWDRSGDDYREIRSVNTIIKAGRAKKLSYAEVGCPCSELFIQPNGTIRWCGCEDAPVLGYAGKFDKQNIYSEYGSYECWKNVPKEVWKLAA